MKFIAATISALSEYILNSTWKIQRVATSAIKLILSHGLAKIKTAHSRNMNPSMFSGFEKIYANIKYFLSSRFTEPANQRTFAASNNALDCSLQLIKAFVDYNSETLLNYEM